VAELFLSGNQRSVKTLVQLILASHPEITISPGTNVIAKVLYGHRHDRPLTPEALRAVRAVMQKDRKLKAWRVDHRAYQALVAGYAERLPTPKQFVHDLMSFFRDQTKPGARYVGNKKGCYCREGDLVKRIFPEAKLVFLLRDARGAVASMLETQPEHDLESAALLWTSKAQRIRTIAAAFPRDCFVVRYERLVADPEAESRALCRFLGLDYAPEMLSGYRTNDAIRHATDTTHHETYQAITTSMVDAWRSDLRPEQIEAIEGIAGHELAAHGYAPTVPRERMEKSARARYRWLRTRDAASFWLAHERRKRAIG